MINSIISVFYSLDDKTLTKMAEFEGGESLKQFCILLTLDIQIEKEIKKHRFPLDT